MRSLLFACCILFLGIETMSAQGVMVYEPGSRGGQAARVIEKGKKGQEYDAEFVDFQSYHFVQFAVYPSTVDRYDLRGPKEIGQSWLIFHKETLFAGSAEKGAYYIVQPFSSEEEARKKAESFKKQGLDCWYNGELTDARFVLVAISFPK